MTTPLITVAAASAFLGLLAWSWLAYLQLRDELAVIRKFEDMHFDVFPPGAG